MGTGKESLKTSSTSLPHSSIQCTFSITKSKTLVKSIAVHKCSSPVIWYLQSLDSVFLSNLKFHWKQSEQFIIHIYKTFAFTRDGQRWDFRPSGHSSVLHFLVGLRESQDHILGIGGIWLWPATIFSIISTIIIIIILWIGWIWLKLLVIIFPQGWL